MPTLFLQIAALCSPRRLSFEWSGGANYHIKRQHDALCINSAGTINGSGLVTAMHSGCNSASMFTPAPREETYIFVQSPFSLFIEHHSKGGRAGGLSKALPKDLVGQHGGSVKGRKHLFFDTPTALPRTLAVSPLDFCESDVIIRTQLSNDIFIASRFAARGVYRLCTVVFRKE